MTRVSDLFFSFFQKNQNLKKKIFLRGVKVGEDWLV